jgi:2-oxoglutarate dehydrogenase complex dehydrogenase (E1) component-like enzyme
VLHDKRLDEPFTFPNNPTFYDRIAVSAYLMQGFISEKQEWTLREILHRLQFIYSNKTGLEFMHLSNAEERAWLMH